MPLTRPYPIDKAWPNAIDLRKHLSGIIPRQGVFPDPVTVDQGIAYANGGWNIGARAFVFAHKRNAAAFTQAYGTALSSHDAAATAWTLSGAPGTGSRIDRLWIRLVDPTQGEALTTPGGETVARAVPIFGVTEGVAGTSPVAPALPTGVFEVAQVTTPAGAASIAGSTITQTYPFAHLIGAPVLFRSQTEQDAYGAHTGAEAIRLDTGARLDRFGGAWRAGDLVQDWLTVAAEAGWTANTGAGTPQFSRIGYQAFYKGGVFGGTANTTALIIPSWARPARTTRVEVPLTNDSVGIVRLFNGGAFQPSGAIHSEAQIQWSVL